MVTLSLASTGTRLGGPPLCYSSCEVCLSVWDNSVVLDINAPIDIDNLARIGCGFYNGKEMLSFYTMAQTSFLSFVTAIVAMAVCMAWRVADEEIRDAEVILSSYFLSLFYWWLF